MAGLRVMGSCSVLLPPQPEEKLLLSPPRSLEFQCKSRFDLGLPELPSNPSFHRAISSSLLFLSWLPLLAPVTWKFVKYQDRRVVNCRISFENSINVHEHEGHSDVSFFFSLFLPAAPREILLLLACSTYVTLNKLQTRSQDVCNVVSRSRTASNIHFSPVLATGLFALVSTLTFLLRNKRVGARVFAHGNEMSPRLRGRRCNGATFVVKAPGVTQLSSIRAYAEKFFEGVCSSSGTRSPRKLLPRNCSLRDQ